MTSVVQPLMSERADSPCRRRAAASLALAALLLALAAPCRAAEAPAAFAVRTPREAPEIAAAIRAGWFFRWRLPRLPGIRVEVGPDAPGAVVAAVVAWPPSPPTARLLAPLPVASAGEDLRLGGDRYPLSEVAVALRLPAAGRPGWPRWIVVGRDPGRVSQVVSGILATEVGGWENEGIDYRVFDYPWLERSGSWRRGKAGWEVDPDRDRDGFAERREWFHSLAPLAGSGVTLLVPAAESRRPEYRHLLGELTAAVAEMAPRVPLPAKARARPVLVAVEADFPSQARHTGAIGEAVPGGPADLHLVYDPADLFAYRVALAGVLIGRAGVGEDLPPWLRRGAALWLAGGWYGRPWRQWLAPLAAAGTVPTAAQLLAPAEQPDSSAPLWTPWAAAVVDGLRGDTLAARLRRTPPAAEVAALLTAAEERGRAVAARTAGDGDGAPPWVIAAPGFLRGVSLAMLNSLDGGYDAPALDARLDRLAALGADAVSLMPFASQRDPHAPGLAFLNRSPGSETDVGVIHAARRAHARGFAVLWKPQLWVGHDSWAGEVEMGSEADWAAWWASYRTFILHHAFLAAWSGSELFSVGVELKGTVGREAEWRRLIADVRRLYPGLVTYSANWYGDLDRATFLDALDLVGVDAYYPLADDARATPAELAAGARRVVDSLAAVARKHGRPVLLTEVGFAARRGAWLAPHEEGGEISETDQAAAYRALLGALDHRSWLAGAFVWKAFSSDPDGRPPGPDFRFLGRPAEAEVRKWFDGGG